MVVNRSPVPKRTGGARVARNSRRYFFPVLLFSNHSPRPNARVWAPTGCSGFTVDGATGCGRVGYRETTESPDIPVNYEPFRLSLGRETLNDCSKIRPRGEYNDAKRQTSNEEKKNDDVDDEI